MKDLIITVMAAAMPYMTWLLWGAAAFAVLAAAGLVARALGFDGPLAVEPLTKCVHQKPIC